MAVLRCNKCANLQEEADGLVGQTTACSRCGNPTVVYSTKFFIEKLLEKYFQAQQELRRLSSQKSAQPNSPAPAENGPLTGLDISNTTHLASDIQHGPIVDWFGRKKIAVQPNVRAIDTTGFFDEVAVSIGSNLGVLQEVLDRIRWAQQKTYSSTTITLERKSAEEIKAITVFCQQLYDFSFVAKSIHNRAKNNVLLVLQTAPAIREFFAGRWLEWFVLMTCLNHAKTRGKRFSCARSLNISCANGDAYELDVFMLIDGSTPICIECKTGEYRQDIDKCLGLKKKLGLSDKHFVMCVAGLSEEHACGMSTMYGLTFVNERQLVGRLQSLF